MRYLGADGYGRIQGVDGLLSVDSVLTSRATAVGIKHGHALMSFTKKFEYCGFMSSSKSTLFDVLHSTTKAQRPVRRMAGFLTAFLCPNVCGKRCRMTGSPVLIKGPQVVLVSVVRDLRCRYMVWAYTEEVVSTKDTV